MNSFDRNNAVWKKIILGDMDFQPSYMAASVLLWRLKLKLKNNRSNEILEEAKNELFDLYFKSKELPKAKADLEILLKK